MAFDKDRHEFDARGFMVEKDTKEIVGQKERWFAPHEDHGSDYPKWVKPHEDHVVETHGHKITPNYVFAVDRDSREIFVLVNDAAEEEMALRGTEPQEADEEVEDEKDA